ncbi:response regulator [Paenibacillus sp. PK3_47]|uniref:response regulator n=1 Tax=Paenibacillus sp. PK3_47 TaxID=2072642 RepID=UPI00201DAA46|nr:response regulator [Paenibacillus sp. PK3_47]
MVIVDDEVLIREGLARMISKESSTFCVVGTFADGRQLLDELPSLQLDLVITDIRMPQIGGLELIRLLKVSHPEIRTLLMSGFVEFDYAREAIRSSAVDYLLKPINKEQLFEVLYTLEKERELQREKEERQRTGMLLPLLQLDEPSAVLMDNLNLPLPYFTVTLLKGGSMKGAIAYSDILRKEQGISSDLLEVHKGLLAWVRYSQEPLTLAERQEPAGFIKTVCPQKRLHFGVSRSYSEPARLRTAYLEAKLACDAGIYNPQLLHYTAIEELELADKAAADHFAPIREPLIHDLQILSITGTTEWIHKLFRSLEAQQASPGLILRSLQQAEEAVRNELPEYEAAQRQENRPKLEEQIRDCMSFGEIEEQFTSMLTKALIKIRTHRLEMSGKAVETVKRWVSAHYNQHADLNTLAGMVFLTPSYLSKLFKQETGMTLTDYMIEIRIRKAKQLLKNAPDLKVHEIGTEVGYPDPAYFNKLFKKVVGVTPNEYKRISMV